MATHSSVLAWRIPRTEKPGRLQSMGLHRVGHDWSNWAASFPTHNKAYLCYYTHKCVSMSPQRAGTLSGELSLFQIRFLCESLQWSEIFPFHSPFLTDSTKAASKFRLDTYLLEFRKERVTDFAPLGESISFKNTLLAMGNDLQL